MKKFIFFITVLLQAQVPNLNIFGGYQQGTSASLALPVQIGDTSITVQNGTCFAYGLNTPCNTAFYSNQLINIDAETMQICSVAVGAGQTTILNIGHSVCPSSDGRGIGGTTPALHFGAVSSFFTTYSYNQILASIFAITNVTGAKGDGITNDSVAIQNSINAANNLYFPNTSANIYVVSKIFLHSNLTISCAPGVTLKMPNGFNGSTDWMFTSSGASETTTWAPTNRMDIGADCIIDGNRTNEVGGTGDGDAVGIYFRGCSYCTVRGTWQNFWTDNIYITGSGTAGSETNPGINDVVAVARSTGARRNNMSVIDSNGITFVGNPEFDHAGGIGGTAPEAGIDFEPNISGQSNININGHFTSHDNGSASVAGAGINFFWSGSSLTSGVTIDCTCFNNTGYGLLAESEGNLTWILDGLTVLGTYYNNGNLTLAPGGYPAIEIISTSNTLISAHVTSDTGTLASAVFIGYGTNVVLSDGMYSGQKEDLRIGGDSSDTATVVNLSPGAVLINDTVAGLNVGNIAQIGSTVLFTPSITFSGLSVGITYSTQIGTYTKIGNTVFLSIHLIITSKGSSSGTLRIIGSFPLPTDQASGTIGYYTGLVGVTANPEIYIPTIGSSTLFGTIPNSPGTGSLILQDTNFGVGSIELVMSITYHCAL